MNGRIHVMSIEHPEEKLLRSADVIAGGKRQLELLPSGLKAEQIVFGAHTLEQARELVRRAEKERIVVLASGDPLYFGIGGTLAKLAAPGQLVIHPGPTAFQLLFARLALPWDGAELFSVHGSCEPLPWRRVLNADTAAVYGDRSRTAADLARELVRRFPASEMSGRAVVLEKIKHIFPHVGVDSQEARALLQELKELESRGYQFEGADASFQLLVPQRLQALTPFFELLYYHIYTDYSDGSDRGASATVKVRVGGQIQLMAAEGNGPVNALDQALRKALEIFYPVLSQVKLTDYKVRVLDSKSATAAGVRVLITSTDGEDTFTTVGVSGDVVAASWKALEDSMEYLLLKTAARQERPQ